MKSDEPWMKDAACKGTDNPDMFFPDHNRHDLSNQAVQTCFSCPVRPDCVDYRKRTKSEYGIWAGQFTKRHSKGQ